MIIYKSGLDIVAASSTIKDVVDTPENWNSIELTVTITGDTDTQKKFEILIPIIESADVTVASGIITLKPSFFDLDELKDGIYQVDVKYWKAGRVGHILETNCSFIDIHYQCKVASTLKAILEEAKESAMEPTGTTIHLLHYALVNGSNCGCNCADMVKAFKELEKLLDGVNTEIYQDCGC